MRLIDANALKRRAQKVAIESWKMKIEAKVETILNQFIDWIDEASTIQPEPKRGKWIPHEDEDGEHYGDKCSECGEWYVMPYGKTNFCPNCGADMREVTT